MDFLNALFGAGVPAFMGIIFLFVAFLYLFMPLYVFSISRDTRAMRKDLKAALSSIQALSQERPVQSLPVKPTPRNSIRVKGYYSIEIMDEETVRIKDTGATYKCRYAYDKKSDEWAIQFKDDLQGLPRV